MYVCPQAGGSRWRIMEYAVIPSTTRSNCRFATSNSNAVSKVLRRKRHTHSIVYRKIVLREAPHLLAQQTRLECSEIVLNGRAANVFAPHWTDAGIWDS